MENQNRFKADNVYKGQRDTMQNIAMAVSGLYTVIPLYAMMLGFMDPIMAVVLFVPASIAFSATLVMNR